MNRPHFFRDQIAGIVALFVCAGFVSQIALAGPGPIETKDGKATATEEQPAEPTNWIELGIGGVIVHGDTAQFEQNNHIPGDQVYGGIQDFHYQQDFGKDTHFVADGHALWDINDYDVKLQLTKDKVGYIQFGYQEFRTWYDGNAGFLPHHNVFFSPPFDEMHIDRGDAWVEVGLRVPDWPEITIRYDHLFRDGMKDSTIWGDTTLTGLAINPARKLAPAFRDIDERRDIVSLDATKNFGDTDVTLGMRYEHSEENNALQLERGAGQLPPAVAAPGAQRFITQNDIIDSDIFNGHAIIETRLKDNTWFTAAYSYSTSGSDLSGGRIVGPDYNSMFGNFPQLQSNDHAILNLAGTSDTEEHVFNANLFWVPFEDLNVIVGFRYTHEDTESDSTFLDLNTSGTPPRYRPLNNPLSAALPKSANTSDMLNNFAERFELRYTKIKNWLFYAEGEWDEENGTVLEHEVSATLVRGVPTPSDLGTLNKDNYLLGQKYTVGANWYPSLWMNLSAQYYYKAADYDNNFDSELKTPPTPGSERNQRLIGQDWTSNDVNVRLTLHPKLPSCLGTMTLVSRYDFLQTEVSGKWAISPGAIGAAPTNTILNEEMTGLITQHSFTESVDWNPLPRFYFQTTFSYILNQTNTPAGHINLISGPGTTTYTDPTVVNFRNDFWTATASAGYILDDKTDLHADYSYYRAPDYNNNDKQAMPYGAGQTENVFSASITRQITKNVRLLFKYTYFTYEDQTSGNHNNYEAHSFYSGLQYRF